MENQADYKAEVEEAMEMLGEGYEPQEIIDDSDLRKYRIEIPNLYDDSDLDPYEFRLLVHYKRVGRCTESTRTTATKCHMSAGQVSKKRKALAEKGFIDMQEVPLEGNQFSYIIIVLDRWQENFSKYSARSLSKQTRSRGEQGVHTVKQRKNHIKKEPIKNNKGADAPRPPKVTDFPELVLYRTVTEKYPPKANWSNVIEKILQVSKRIGRQPTAEDLFPYYSAWTGNGWNQWSINWLDYAVKGELPNRQVKGQEEPKAFNAVRQYVNSLQGEVNGISN